MSDVQTKPKRHNRAGRPAKVTRTQIAEATLAIGMDRATVRAVAQALGMSTPGLYHHVRIREDLLDIAAAHALRLRPIPDPAGKTWEAWLSEHARQVFDVLVTQPAFITYMLSGPHYASARLEQLEQILQVLMGWGFSLEEAYETYLQVISAVIGAAGYVARENTLDAAGHGRDVDVQAALSELGTDALPLVRRLYSGRAAEKQEIFETVMRTVLDGIAVRRGASAETPRKPRRSSGN
jgi:AcrR family transcriptional regulator